MWSCTWSNKRVKSCYCVCSRLSTDQGDLWREQPVACRNDATRGRPLGYLLPFVDAHPQPETPCAWLVTAPGNLIGPPLGLSVTKDNCEFCNGLACFGACRPPRRRPAVARPKTLSLAWTATLAPEHTELPITHNPSLLAFDVGYPWHLCRGLHPRHGFLAEL